MDKVVVFSTVKFSQGGCDCIIEEHLDHAVIKAGSKVNALREHAKVRPEFKVIREMRAKLSKSSKITGGIVRKDIKVQSLNMAKRICYGGNP